MISPKDLLALLLFKGGVTRLANAVTGPRLTIFGYHRVRDNRSSVAEAGFDTGVVGPTPAQLELQLRWLQMHLRILSEDDLLSAVQEPESITSSCAMITFDDGYRDNFTLALPVLRALDIPAIFFIPTGMIESGRLGWWDLIPYFLKRTNARRINWSGHSFQLPAQLEPAIGFFDHVMKSHPAGQTECLLELLSQKCSVPFPDAGLQREQFMTWEQIQLASQAGVAIGSHAHSHRVLATLSKPEVADELTRSKDILEERIGSTIRSLAYPCGGYNHFTPQIQRQAVECGYSLSYSFNTGTIKWPNELDTTNLKRIGASPYLPRFSAMTGFPRLLSWPVNT